MTDADLLRATALGVLLVVPARVAQGQTEIGVDRLVERGGRGRDGDGEEE
jgi:hypothetical protein